MSGYEVLAPGLKLARVRTRAPLCEQIRGKASARHLGRNRYDCVIFFQAPVNRCQSFPCEGARGLPNSSIGAIGVRCLWFGARELSGATLSCATFDVDHQAVRRFDASPRKGRDDSAGRPEVQARAGICEEGAGAAYDLEPAVRLGAETDDGNVCGFRISLSVEHFNRPALVRSSCRRMWRRGILCASSFFEHNLTSRASGCYPERGAVLSDRAVRKYTIANASKTLGLLSWGFFVCLRCAA
jgi:hypothetical protein